MASTTSGVRGAELAGDLRLGRVVRYQQASTGWQRFCGRPAVITGDILHTVQRPGRVQSPATPYRGSASATRAVGLSVPDKRDPPSWLRRTAVRSVARGAGRRVRPRGHTRRAHAWAKVAAG